MTLGGLLLVVAFQSTAVCADLPANQVELAGLLKSAETNPVFRAAIKQADGTKEVCEPSLIRATKPGQFEDGTVFDFTITVKCQSRWAGRVITFVGRWFQSLGDADPITIKVARFD